MTCQTCGDEATIHLTETVSGQVRDRHLCHSCARAQGVRVPSAPPNLALDKVVNALIVAKVGELTSELADRACPCCGSKFMEFRAEGALGCPHDYQAFSKGLLPILRRAHGATRHVGKIPARNGRLDSAALLRLRARLRLAVANEQYERAARLRDRIRESIEGSTS